MAQPCLGLPGRPCDEIAVSGPRCPTCSATADRGRRQSGGKRYGRSYQRARAAALARSPVCVTCGEPARPGDPLTGGHVVPRILGGTEAHGIVPQHRSCNARQGAR